MTRPNFFILGAAKAGTTSLYHCLKQHPDIGMSVPKEPLFFEAEYDLGLDHYRRRYFRGCAGARAIGDARHRNLYLPFVPPRILESAPDARLIVMLRNPVDRALSHWWHWYVRGIEALPFDDAVEANLARLKSGPFFETPEEARLYADTLDRATGYSLYPSYLDSGYYAEQIERYVRLFGKERMMIVFSEDLAADAASVVRKVFEFLDVDPEVRPDSAPQNRALPPAGHRVMTLFRNVPGRRLVPTAVRTRVKRKVETWLSGPTPSIPAATRRALTEHFEPHVRDLEKMTGRDLTAWRIRQRG